MVYTRSMVYIYASGKQVAVHIRSYQLFDNNDFTDKKDEVDVNADGFNFYLGRFKNIPVYTTWSSRMTNKVLVCDFDNAFEMQVPLHEEGDPLHFTIDRISNGDAAILLEKDPLKYGRKPDGSLLSTELALARISAMLKMGLWTKAAFRVKNNKAYLLTRVVSADTILPEQKPR